MFSLICARNNGWVNNRKASDLRRHLAHYDVTVMMYVYRITCQHWDDALTRKCRHFDEISITGCTESCQNDNFRCSQWWKFQRTSQLCRFSESDVTGSLEYNENHVWYNRYGTAKTIIFFSFVWFEWFGKYHVVYDSIIMTLCMVANPSGLMIRETKNRAFERLLILALQWRHNERYGVSNHHPHEYFRNRSLTLSQCTLAGPVYTGMPLECHWLTQCTLEHHWKNLVETAPHWNATGES